MITWGLHEASNDLSKLDNFTYFTKEDLKRVLEHRADLLMVTRPVKRRVAMALTMLEECGVAPALVMQVRLHHVSEGLNQLYGLRLQAWLMTCEHMPAAFCLVVCACILAFDLDRHQLWHGPADHHQISNVWKCFQC